MQSRGEGSLNRQRVIFNASRRELFTLATNYKQVHRRLRSQYNVEINQQEIITDKLLNDAFLLVIAASQQSYENGEIVEIKRFLRNGGRLLLLGCHTSENHHSNTILNPLVEEFGITLNHDTLIRTVFHKYCDPQEALINDAALGKQMHILSKQMGQGRASSNNDECIPGHESSLQLVYPFGSTLQVSKPAIPFMSSGQLCFPAERAIAAICNVDKGIVIVTGSAHMFCDEYFTCESNAIAFDMCLDLLVSNIKMDQIDEDAAEYGERTEVPDVASLADRLQSCLQEGDELPSDFTTLFDTNQFTYNMNMIPDVLSLYEKLNVKHEPLTLIPPQFEVPQPPLQPATYVPTMRDLPPPPLELYDLDDQFATVKSRLAQITNKCSDEDLSYFIKEAGEILGVVDKLPEKNRSPQHILAFVLHEIFRFKSMDQPRHTMGADH